MTSPRQTLSSKTKRFTISREPNREVVGFLHLGQGEEETTLELADDQEGTALATELHDALETHKKTNVHGDEFLAMFAQALQGMHLLLQPQTGQRITTSISVSTVDGFTGHSTAEGGKLSASGKDIAEKVFESIAGIGRKLGKELLENVRSAVELGDHERVRSLLEDWRSAGAFFRGGEGKAYEACRLIDVEALPATSQKEFLLLRCALGGVAESLDALTAADIRILQSRFGGELSGREVATVKTIEASLAANDGRTDTAFMLWREVAETEGVEPVDRGWAHHNISRAQPSSDPTTVERAQLAADSFLESGHLEQAAREIVFISRIVLVTDPKRAIADLEEAETWFAGDSSADLNTRAQILHSKAEAFERLGEKQKAKDLHLRGAELLGGLHGTRNLVISSLAHASVLAENLGDHEEATQLRRQVDALIEEEDTPTWRRRKAATSLANAYRAQDAEAIAEEAATSGDWDVYANVLILRATHEGSPKQRVEWLDEVLALNAKRKAPREDRRIAHFAMGLELANQERTERALEHFKKALNLDPLDGPTRQNVGALLMSLKLWDEAIAFFMGQQKIFGELPGILTALAQALLESGRPGEAIPLLAAVRMKTVAGSPAHSRASELESRAYQAGGTPQIQTTLLPAKEPLTFRRLREEVESFCSYAAAEQRRSFWKSGKAKDWRSSPERHAQTLLETFLAGRLPGQLEALREVDSGAGRMDIYVVGHGGFRCVIELKMLGAGYSSTYAFSGVDQITHYLKNKSVHVGILVLFDARANDFGKGIDPVQNIEGRIVHTYFVDVRRDTGRR